MDLVMIFGSFELVLCLGHVLNGKKGKVERKRKKQKICLIVFKVKTLLIITQKSNYWFNLIFWGVYYIYTYKLQLYIYNSSCQFVCFTDFVSFWCCRFCIIISAFFLLLSEFATYLVPYDTFHSIYEVFRSSCIAPFLSHCSLFKSKKILQIFFILEIQIL